MYVCRVEHKDTKKGPYYAAYNKLHTKESLNECDKILISHSQDHKHHPIPEMFIAFNYRHNPHFGFETLDKLFDWFGDCINLLEAEGYEIIEFEVDEYLFNDELQVAFKRPKEIA